MTTAWWKMQKHVRLIGSEQRGVILHVLPSGTALVQWDRVREARYVGVHDLAPAKTVSRKT